MQQCLIINQERPVRNLKDKLATMVEEDAEVMDNLRALRGERYALAVEVAVELMHLHLGCLRLLDPLVGALMRPMIARIDGKLQNHLAEQLRVDPEQLTRDVLMVVERRSDRCDQLLKGQLP